MQKFALALWASLPADYLGRCIIIEVHDERFAELVVEVMMDILMRYFLQKESGPRSSPLASSASPTIHAGAAEGYFW